MLTEKIEKLADIAIENFMGNAKFLLERDLKIILECIQNNICECMNPLLCNNGLIPTTVDIEEDQIFFIWKDFEFSHQQTSAIYRIKKYCTILNNYQYELKIDKKESYTVVLYFTEAGIWKSMSMNDYKNGIAINFSNIRTLPDRMMDQYVTDLRISYTITEDKKKEIEKKYKR